MSQTEVSELAAALDAAGGGPDEYVLLGFPDLNGYLRGKALRRNAFEAAVRDGTVMTDLLLGLDPVDAPITSYESFGIRSGAGDLVLHPDVETLHELTWRPGWSVCLGTPSWRDGSPCELSVRETLRRALDAMAELGYDVRAAVEYEIRIWDSEGQPLSTGISYSLVEVGRYHELVSALAPALAWARRRARGRPHGGRPGAPRAQPRRARRPEGRRRRGLREARGQGGRFDARAPRQLPRQDRARGGGLERPRPPLVLVGRRERVRGARAGLCQAGRGRDPRAPAGRLAPPEPDRQLLQTARARLVRAHQRELGPRTARARSVSSAGTTRAGPASSAAGPGPTRTPTWRWPPLWRPRPTGSSAAPSRPSRSRVTPTPATTSPVLPGSLESALAAFRADDGLRVALGEEFSDYYATSREWELSAWREAVSDWERERYERAV